MCLWCLCVFVLVYVVCCVEIGGGGGVCGLKCLCCFVVCACVWCALCVLINCTCELRLCVFVC